MLQRQKSGLAASTNPIEAEFASVEELFTSLTAFVRRQLPTILLVLGLTIGLGFVYILTTPATYTADATMIIDTRKVQLFQQPSVLGDVPIDSATVESQVEILKSENVALSVIKDLRLTENQDFMKPQGGLIGWVAGFVSNIFSSNEPESNAALLRRAVEKLQNGLTIKRVGLSYVILVSFSANSPQQAANIANAVADAYIVDQLEAKYQTTRRASVWLQDRIRELRAQASQAERAVVDFKTKNNIVDTGGRLINEQQLTETNSSLAAARTQTAEAKARLDRIEEIRRLEIPDATVTDSLRNEVITRLRQQYLDLSNRAADWMQRYGRDHLAVINLNNQMREIRAAISNELGRIAETYKSDYEIAKAREDSLQQSLKDIITESQAANQAQIELRELESTAQTYRALHDNFLQKYMEAVQQQSFPITEARVITQASAPVNKSHPKTILVLALALTGGALLGFGAGMLREWSDRVFRTTNDVEGILQTDCVSIVPLIKARAAKAATQHSPTSDPSLRRIVYDNGLLWYAINAPFSRFAESIRSIKVAWDLSNSSKSNKVIGITSSLPNEGKSTIAASLAGLLAQSGARVILIDCDLRNPSLSRHVAPEATRGLYEVVTGQASLADVAWMDSSRNLTFLPWVMETRTAHVGDILTTERTKLFFDALRNTYDYVVVDLSPLSPVVDVRTTVKLIDAYFFVVEWGRTKIDVVEQALNSASSIYNNLLGVVLNKADQSTLGRYETYRGNYYSKYHSRYGYTD